ncbi:MAG: hypothetical protein LBT63_03280 [Holosporaceae bacterium]|jgi:hypothetical protein|nr:hypothetical protein [Holosporaceae bacterium]
MNIKNMLSGVVAGVLLATSAQGMGDCSVINGRGMASTQLIGMTKDESMDFMTKWIADMQSSPYFIGMIVTFKSDSNADYELVPLINDMSMSQLSMYMDKVPNDAKVMGTRLATEGDMKDYEAGLKSTEATRKYYKPEGLSMTFYNLGVFTKRVRQQGASGIDKIAVPKPKRLKRKR